jgi:hypothetical protein
MQGITQSAAGQLSPGLGTALTSQNISESKGNDGPLRDTFKITLS